MYTDVPCSRVLCSHRRPSSHLHDLVAERRGRTRLDGRAAAAAVKQGFSELRLSWWMDIPTCFDFTLCLVFVDLHTHAFAILLPVNIQPPKIPPIFLPTSAAEQGRTCQPLGKPSRVDESRTRSLPSTLFLASSAALVTAAAAVSAAFATADVAVRSAPTMSARVAEIQTRRYIGENRTRYIGENRTRGKDPRSVASPQTLPSTPVMSTAAIFPTQSSALVFHPHSRSGENSRVLSSGKNRKSFASA